MSMLEDEQSHWVHLLEVSSLTIGQMVANSLVEKRSTGFAQNLSCLLMAPLSGGAALQEGQARPPHKAQAPRV